MGDTGLKLNECGIIGNINSDIYRVYQLNELKYEIFQMRVSKV